MVTSPGCLLLWGALAISIAAVSGEQVPESESAVNVYANANVGGSQQLGQSAAYGSPFKATKRVPYYTTQYTTFTTYHKVPRHQTKLHEVTTYRPITKYRNEKVPYTAFCHQVLHHKIPSMLQLPETVQVPRSTVRKVLEPKTTSQQCKQFTQIDYRAEMFDEEPQSVRCPLFPLSPSL